MVERLEAFCTEPSTRPEQVTTLVPRAGGAVVLAQRRGAAHGGRRAGRHSVKVLLSVYAACLDGERDAYNARIQDLLDGEA